MVWKRRRNLAVESDDEEENQLQSKPRMIDTPAAGNIFLEMNQNVEPVHDKQQCSKLWYEETPIGKGTKPTLQKISPEDKQIFLSQAEELFWKDPKCTLNAFVAGVKKQEPQYKSFGIDKRFQIQNLYYRLKNEATTTKNNSGAPISVQDLETPSVRATTSTTSNQIVPPLPSLNTAMDDTVDTFEPLAGWYNESVLDDEISRFIKLMQQNINRGVQFFSEWEISQILASKEKLKLFKERCGNVL